MVRREQAVFVDLLLSFIVCMLPGVGNFSHVATAAREMLVMNEIKLLFYQML